MNSFAFSTAGRILFGAGRFAEVGAVASGYGRRICLVTGRHAIERSGRLDELAGRLGKAGLSWIRVMVHGEPTVEAVDEAAAEARRHHSQVVVAVGGGSVLDSGKAIAALLTNPGKAVDYLEGVGSGAKLDVAPAPLVAVPTTAGTGSEATRNAVIGNRARTFKKSMRADGLLPAVAVVDPELTHDCPAGLTASCGMDAVTQLLEAFTSRRSCPLTDALALEGLGRAGALARLAVDPRDAAARESMALASLLGGICLANAGLGAVHGLASPVGAQHPIAHGAVCAALLPAVVWINANRAAHEGNGALLAKYRAACERLFGGLAEMEPTLGKLRSDRSRCPRELADNLKAAEFLAHRLAELNAQLGLRGLGHYGLDERDFPPLVADGRGTSMKSNPVELSDEELTEILDASLA